VRCSSLPLLAGIHRGVSHDEYHADPCKAPSLSSHMAGVLLGLSPLHAWQAHPKLGRTSRSKDTDAKDAGSIRHKLVFGVGPAIVVVDADDWRKSDAQQTRDEARARGEIPVLARKMREAENEAAIIIDGYPVPINECDVELTVVWFDAELGIWCRARLDSWHAPTATIYDLKNCDNLVAAASGTTCIKFGYDIQAAAYIEGIETCLPELAGRVQFKFHFVEPGITPCTPDLSGELLELGRRKWRRAKELWAQCLKSGTWPGPQIARIEAPPWAVAQDMEQQLKQIEGGSSDVSF
jgi:hypothetical protein